MITVLSGPNQYGISQKLATIKADFIREFGPAGVEIYSGEQIQIESLASLLSGVTLFASNRLVIIRDLSSNKVVAEQLLSILKSIPSEVHVLLLEGQLDKRTAYYKTLKKEADFYELGELEGEALATWVGGYVKAQGGTIANRTIHVLINYVGSDQLRLVNELDKLIAFNPEITESAITDLVEKRPEDTVFQLLDSALGGKQRQALTILEELESAHEDPFQIANMLIWQTHILAVVSSSNSVPEADLAKATKLNPFVVRKTKGLAARLGKQDITKIINAVAALDIRLKSTATNPWQVIEQTILAFG